ncbi:hypothetical protein SAMN05421740_10217 [Parapedobacter koreensis]|uniref:Uncharacterized protein n=1 Tax=Parapedobacter koreensis TaxID=332977 RepID=A0A1H7HUC5_9SPHI|nr:hypothetical protein SAMN05421740_10217 [Parapedobacter koreensis]
MDFFTQVYGTIGNILWPKEQAETGACTIDKSGNVA